MDRYPVVAPMGDTILYIYTRTGAMGPAERAKRISERIREISDQEFFEIDSLKLVAEEGSFDILYAERVIFHLNEREAKAQGKELEAFAEEVKDRLAQEIMSARESNSIEKILLRIAYSLVGLVVLVLVIGLVGKLFRRLLVSLQGRKHKYLRDLTYKDYTFLTADQELQALFFVVKVVKWVVNFALIYLALSLIFSIFPATRSWANLLFEYVRSPLVSIFMAVWDFLPNFFTILVIVIVMRYFIKFVKYIFQEIEAEKLKIPDFHADWAMPTYGIVRVLLYAFMLVLVFPYLPGSDSNIFRGVSVFLGLLISFGSSSAIANMVAGLVITYMRPFKIGDRIKIGDISGAVVEKTLLVTRLQTIKNEEITIPNSTILNSNTTNFSAMAHREGLLIHTTVTIGYDVPWRIMHQTLIAAAKKTSGIKDAPEPFVLQTSLEDFYVAYQINAYTDNAKKMVLILSELHQNIQDECNSRGIEILSPHYRGLRDGNNTTIPSEYLEENYKAPPFQIKLDRNDDKS